uniref:Fatty-acid-binding protein 1 n=1 Tax=Tanacetum cinerariifolium TaxID=118510 RepID=A0A699HG83_TANCI|nr:fatty-acid-binding protein 1 [Tanacetum cinerariifolium]
MLGMRRLKTSSENDEYEAFLDVWKQVLRVQILSWHSGYTIAEEDYIGAVLASLCHASLGVYADDSDIKNFNENYATLSTIGLKNADITQDLRESDVCRLLLLVCRLFVEKLASDPFVMHLKNLWELD